MRKLNFKFICPVVEDGKTYQVYYDRKRGCYVSINDNCVCDITNLKQINIIRYLECISDQMALKDTKEKATSFKSRLGVLLALGVVSGVCLGGVKFLENKYQEEKIYINSEHEKENRLVLLNSCLDKNDTLNNELKEELRVYLNLFAEYDSDMSVVKVATKIKSYDFNEEKNVTPFLLCKLFDFHNGEFIARELYLAVNQKDNNRIPFSYGDLLANYLYFNEVARETILCGNDIELEINGKKYLVCVKDYYPSYYSEVYNYLENYQEEMASQNGFPKESVFKTNLFSTIAKVYTSGSDVPKYIKKDGNVFVDCSDSVYQNKLFRLLIEKGDQFDYHDKDSRILLYFYIDTLKRTYGVEYEDISSYIYQNMKERDSVLTFWNTPYSYFDLLNYLENGSFSYEGLKYHYDLAFDSLAIGVLQELNLCLKMEVEEGNISQENYDYFIVRVNEILANNPINYEKFKEADETNSNIDGFELKLVDKENM